MLFFVPIDNGHTYGPFNFDFTLRSRYEVRNDLNFDSSLDEELTTWNNRGRIGFNYDTGEDDSKLRVTYQYTQTNFDDGGSSFDITCQDLIEAYLQRTWDGGMMRLGRQAVNLGSGRLVGSNEWGDTGRYWNGVRFQNGNWDFFTGRLDMDMTGVGEHYLGFLGYDWGYGGQTNLIYHWSHWGNPSIYTVDHTFSKQYGNLNLHVEGAWQWGRDMGVDLEAWAGAVTGKIEVSDRLAIYGGYVTASGGSSGSTSNTFNDLFPSDHRFNGIMDLQGWRNVNAFNAGVGFKLNDTMGLKIMYHSFKLNDADDVWYNARNGPNYGYGTNGSDDIGTEIDVSFMWHAQSNMHVSAGFAVFDPGAYVAAEAGSDSNQTWFFGSLGWKF